MEKSNFEILFDIAVFVEDLTGNLTSELEQQVVKEEGRSQVERSGFKSELEFRGYLIRHIIINKFRDVMKEKDAEFTTYHEIARLEGFCS